MTQAFRNERVRSVLAKFGGTAFARSSICGEFESFLRRIKAQGDCCLEIGTFYGVSTMVLAQFFKRVITVTIETPNVDLTMKHRIWEHVGATNIRAFDVANNKEKARLIGQLDFDFAYPDGDHTNDTAEDFALVKRCGRVLFHEYWPLQTPVWNLVNSLPQDQVLRAEFDCLAYWQRA